MRESDTYLAIFEQGYHEGRLLEAKRWILRTGQTRLGPPNQTTTAAIEEIEDLERLERIIDRVFERSVTAWPEVLSTP
jgi:hypothetical protein